MIFCLFLLEEKKEEEDKEVDCAACGGVVVTDRGFVYSMSAFFLLIQS